MKKNKKIKYLIIPLLIFGFYSIALAIDYTLLEPLPVIGGGTGNVNNLGTYFSQLFTLSISIATALAVFKISQGGLTYMTTEAFQGKSDAKDTIKNAVFGLVLILSAWLLLNVINPNLVTNSFTIPPAGGLRSSIETTGNTESGTTSSGEFGGTSSGTGSGGGDNQQGNEDVS